MAVNTVTYSEAGRDAPAYHYAAVTPHDTDMLPAVSRGVAFATAGALALTEPDGTERVIPSGVLAAGVIHPVMAKRIKSTGTTAADIWIFW